MQVSNSETPRHEWRKLFQSAGPSDDDEVLLEAVPENSFDHEDWHWEEAAEGPISE